jgi:hypothetical protein
MTAMAEDFPEKDAVDPVQPEIRRIFSANLHL